MAIVLPQGIFNNRNDQYIRDFIIRRARILGVIGLHESSFKPHTGTKTSILLLRKFKSLEDSKLDFPIFFAVSKVPFKDESGQYIFLRDKVGNFQRDQNNDPIYRSDLFQIAEDFIKWGKNRVQENKDSYLDFVLDEGE